MSYQVHIKLKDAYVHAQVEGKRNKKAIAEDAMSALTEIAAFSALKKKKHIVIEWNVDGIADRQEGLVLMSNLEQCNWNKNFRCAICFRGEDNLKINRFTEKVAQHLGWQVKFFQDCKGTLEWLANPTKKAG